jgi:hypothetical protein
MINSDPVSHYLFSIIITSFKYNITPDEDDRVQYDNWNPLNGTRYSKQQHALNSTRGRAICGTSSSSLSNSDSEDDDIVVENNHSMEVSSCFLFLWLQSVFPLC